MSTACIHPCEATLFVMCMYTSGCPQQQQSSTALQLLEVGPCFLTRPWLKPWNPAVGADSTPRGCT
jgi:hypothetical protein